MFCRQSVSDCGYGEYCMMWLFSQENVIQFVFRRRRLYATRTVLLMITKIKWFFFDLLTCLYYTSKWNSSERPDGAAGVDKAFCSDSQCSRLEPCSANRGWVYEKSNSSDMQSKHLLVIAFTEKCYPGKTWVDDPPATFSVRLYSLGVSNAEVASELICMQVRVALNSAFDVCCLYWSSQREPWNESTNYNQWEKWRQKKESCYIFSNNKLRYIETSKISAAN